MVAAEMTHGECRTLASLASGIQPDSLEACLIIAFVHHGEHDHDVIVSGDVVGYAPMAASLVAMAERMIEQGGTHAGENRKPSNSSQGYRLVCHICSSGWFGDR